MRAAIAAKPALLSFLLSKKLLFYQHLVPTRSYLSLWAEENLVNIEYVSDLIFIDTERLVVFEDVI